MKKILCLMMALLVIVLPLVALGETAEVETMVYEHEEGYYSFQYPADWMLLSKSTIDGVMALVESLENSELSAMIQSVKAQIEQADIIMLMSSDMQSNVNVVRSESSGITDANQFMDAADTFKSQLSAQMPGISFISDPAVLSIGNYDAFVLEYTTETMGTTQYCSQFYVVSGDNLCVFTLTTAAEDQQSVSEAFGIMLGTLTIN